MQDKKNVIVDCDPGIDDSLALMLALACEDIEIKAVTAVYGNVDIEQSLENILKIFSVCRIKNIPFIGRGASNSLSAQPYKPRFVHGVNGLGNADLERKDLNIKIEKADDLIKRSLLEDKVDTIITLGPLTNIAQVLVEEPVVKDSIKEMVIMGGAVYTTGNATNEAEFNFYQDAEAAKIVLNSKIPIKLISLDATRQILYSKDMLKRVNHKKDSQLSNFIHQMFTFALDYHKKYRQRDGVYLPDVLAMCAFLDEETGHFKDLSLDVDIEKDKGKVFINLQAANSIKFLEEVDRNKTVDIFVNGINKLIG